MRHTNFFNSFFRLHKSILSPSINDLGIRQSDETDVARGYAVVDRIALDRGKARVFNQRARSAFDILLHCWFRLSSSLKARHLS